MRDFPFVVLLAVSASLALAPRAARAQSDAGVTVRGDRVEAQRAAVEGTSTFATSIDARERGPLVENAADLLDEAPGVQARRTGDGLSPTVVTLRGAPATHVTIALDGTVLNDAEGEAVDLSLIAPAFLERIDVYRGIPPVRFGMGGLGGAIELVSRSPGPRPSASITAGYGSFDTRRASAMISASHGPVRTLLGIAYRGTQGDFAFYDDQGAPMGSTARTTTRVNNQGDAFAALDRTCITWRGTTCLLITTDVRRRGVPGPGFEQLTSPWLEQERILVRASHRATIADGWIEPFATVMARRDRFRDEAGQITPGVALDSRTASTAEETGAMASARVADVRLSPVLRARAEQFATSSSDVVVSRAQRAAALLGSDARVARGPWELSGGIAIEAMQDATDVQSSPRALVSPRIGARVVSGPMEFRANLGHLERAPTLLELYGLDGFVLANPTLVPERADSADAGAVLHASWGDASLRVEADAYGRRARDLIVFVRRGPVGSKAFNLDAAQIVGGEALARFAWRDHLAVVASYAYTGATTIAPGTAADGRRPPGIPEHDLYARVEGRLGPVSAWIDVSYLSGVYFDEANAAGAPPRTLLDAAVTLAIPHLRGLSVTVMVTNLFDQRTGISTVQPGNLAVRQPIEDFQGYPLPGRSIFAGVAYAVEPLR